ncbi:hypothetical protein D5086_027209 [Populus alba]|uniref:Uncharacterized protein n=1 Tax=Populus alba TaxID=43335 RepID=A0ACC4B415_POPAL
MQVLCSSSFACMVPCDLLLCLLSTTLLNIALLFGFVLCVGVFAFTTGLVLSTLHACPASGDIGCWFCIGFVGADSQLVNDSTILALEAPFLSRIVHVIVPPNLNSNQSLPVVLAPKSACPHHHVISASHGSVPQNHGDPSPSINHVFVKDCSDDDDFDDEEVDFDSFEEDYAGDLNSSPLQCLRLPLSLLLHLQAHNSIALVPKGKDSIFNRLGPQEGTSVVECSEANLPADCVPNSIQVEAKPVSMCGANAPQRITHMVHMDRQLSPLYSVAHDILAPPPKDLAGYRTNKGKSVVVSGAPAMMHLLQVLSSDWVPVVVAVVADFFFSGLQLAFVVNDLFVLQFSMWVLGFSLFCFVSYLSPNDRQSYMAPLHG